MEEWREIPNYPAYKLSNTGELIRLRTGKTLKVTVTPYGVQTYQLFNYTANTKQQISKQKLMATVFGDNTEIPKVAPKITEAPTKSSLPKTCENCNWCFSGSCAVLNPGMISAVELDSTCRKWERTKSFTENEDFSTEDFFEEH
jgi:hypothetical protein